LYEAGLPAFVLYVFQFAQSPKAHPTAGKLTFFVAGKRPAVAGCYLSTVEVYFDPQQGNAAEVSGDNEQVLRVFAQMKLSVLWKHQYFYFVPGQCY
jgi:hypothetical protein